MNEEIVGTICATIMVVVLIICECIKGKNGK